VESPVAAITAIAVEWEFGICTSLTSLLCAIVACLLARPHIMFIAVSSSTNRSRPPVTLCCTGLVAVDH